MLPTSTLVAILLSASISLTSTWFHSITSISCSVWCTDAVVRHWIVQETAKTLCGRGRMGSGCIIKKVQYLTFLVECQWPSWG